MKTYNVQIKRKGGRWQVLQHLVSTDDGLAVALMRKELGTRGTSMSGAREQGYVVGLFYGDRLVQIGWKGKKR